MRAEERILSAHIALMQDIRTVAYSGIIMVGKTNVSDDESTARTNGRDVIYGRQFIDSLSDPEVRALVIHEAKHKMYQHLIIWKKLYEEDADLANRACDYVINLEIQDLDRTGKLLKLPPDGLVDSRFRGMDTLQVFNILKEDKESGQGQGGGGSSIDSHDWQNASSMSADEQQQLSKDIDNAVRTGALLASKQGGKTERSFEALMTSHVDWREQLRDFVTTTCIGKGDSTWAKPNRRWLQHDVYMPSQISESMASIVIAIDTSGSIDTETITKALGELIAICDNVNPEKVDLLYWDTVVASHEQYTGDYSRILSSTKPKGGGGTEVVCVFDYIWQNNLKPDVCVIITDGYTPYPDSQPIPTLWAMIGSDKVAPFGSTIHIRG